MNPPMAPSAVPVVFDCEGARLLGMVHPAAGPGDAAGDVGLVIVVGGPQYRVGAHRQFVHLARAAAAAGIPAFRFDHRGIGDSEGELRSFQAVDADIAAAITAFQAHRPEVRRVVLWGLCDAASAILFYAHRDSRVAGAVLANPWVRSDHTESQARIRFYYPRRLVSRAFWQRLAAGKVDVAGSLRGLWQAVNRARGRAGDRAAPEVSGEAAPDAPDSGDADFPRRMAEGFARLKAPTLFLLSGQDLTAGEFRILAARDRIWRKQLRRPNVTWRCLDDANHTFSVEAQRTAVAEETLRWIETELRPVRVQPPRCPEVAPPPGNH